MTHSLDGDRTTITCGVDLVDVAAFGRALDVTGGRMTEVCFTGKEKIAAGGRVDRLATRWAVKEAVAKALGIGLLQGIGFHDIEVMSDGAAPHLALHGQAAELAERRKFTDWAMSVSHERGLAIALVIGSNSGKDRETLDREEERDG